MRADENSKGTQPPNVAGRTDRCPESRVCLFAFSRRERRGGNAIGSALVNEDLAAIDVDAVVVDRIDGDVVVSVARHVSDPCDVNAIRGPLLVTLPDPGEHLVGQSSAGARDDDGDSFAYGRIADPRHSDDDVVVPVPVDITRGRD